MASILRVTRIIANLAGSETMNVAQVADAFE